MTMMMTHVSKNRPIHSTTSRLFARVGNYPGECLMQRSRLWELVHLSPATNKTKSRCRKVLKGETTRRDRWQYIITASLKAKQENSEREERTYPQMRKKQSETGVEQFLQRTLLHRFPEEISRSH